jgi:hypothetical protein
MTAELRQPGAFVATATQNHRSGLPGNTALQHNCGTAAKLPLQGFTAMSAFPHSLELVKPREIFIRGVTTEGRTFRPSDWAERLAGLMARFRPVGLCRKEAHLGYSPYCVPTLVDGVRCLVVSESLRDIEPMAFDFLLNFARDNQLDVVEACLTQAAVIDAEMDAEVEDLQTARETLQRVFQTA